MARNDRTISAVCSNWIVCVPASSSVPVELISSTLTFAAARIDVLGVVALQAEDDRAGRAVPGAGGAQRAIQLDPYPRDVRQQPVVGEMTGEPTSGAHGADGVRARRPDPDGEQIKY